MPTTHSTDELARSPISKLPEEVLDIIFDLARRVDRHKRTIHACRNVSRAWSHVTLKHYFHSLSLIYRLEGESSIVTCFVQDFVIDEVFNMVKSYVQELTLASSMKASGPITTDLLGYVTFFPVLRQLNLSGVLSVRIPRDIFITRGYTPSITGLSVVQERSGSQWHPDLEDVAVMCDLLHVCTDIRSLSLKNLSWPRRRHILWGEWQGLRGVTSLAVRNVDPILLGELANRTLLFTNLKRGDLSTYFGRGNNDPFVRSVAAGLEHLEYIIPRDEDEHYVAGVVGRGPVNSLAAFRALRSLSVEVEHHDSRSNQYQETHGRWRAMLKAFTSLDPRASLDYIIIRLISGDIVSQDNKVDPSRLAKTLHPGLVADVDTVLATMIAEGRLLRVYTGMYSCSAEYVPRHAFLRDAPDFLRKTFPKLHELGALQLLGVYDDVD